jgi:hypothetical protein
MLSPLYIIELSTTYLSFYFYFSVTLSPKSIRADPPDAGLLHIHCYDKKYDKLYLL